jgi:iron complex outermembrane recepter protein
MRMSSLTSSLRNQLLRLSSLRLTSRGVWERKTYLSALCVTLISITCWAADPQVSAKKTQNLADMSIEELMNESVTSVSKKETKFAQSAAAIFVINQEDIRRSGLTSIPELLRMVPGINVARIDANKWAVSARGFNGRWSGKMQVLIDGRSVYTPFFSGVYWDVQDLILEDVDRIEVIRGPGATLWGSNAVNGVINIITKRAEDTQGSLVSVVSGGEDRGIGSARYGGKLGHGGHYRVYAKYFNRDNLVDSSGRQASDGWDQLHGGFRTDWKLSDKDSLTVQGDIYTGDVGTQAERMVSLAPPRIANYADETGLSGGNVLARWSHAFSPRSDIAVQTYYDGSTRSGSVLPEYRTVLDFDFQHHLALGKRHDVVWGLGIRDSDDRTVGSLGVSFQPANYDLTLFNLFAQDQIALVQDRLHLTLGTKLEDNSFTGTEVQPNGRLLWTPNDRHSVWAAVSRAVRLPSRADTGLRVNIAAFPGKGGSLNVLSLFGNPDFRSEGLVAHELGYRIQPSKRLFVDAATFYNRYDRLSTVEPAVPFFETNPSPPHLVIPLRFDNKMRGKSYGTEVAANFNVTSRWKLSSSYTWLKIQLNPDSSSKDSTARGGEGDSPSHQWVVRSQLTLPRNLEFDTTWYFVSKLTNQNVPAYNRADARLGWRLTEGLDFSLGIQNGLDPRHAEFGSGEGIIASQAKRTAYGRFTWRF